MEAMKGGRKNLKRAAGEETFIVQQGQSVMRVVSLRGSNLIEVTERERERERKDSLSFVFVNQN